MKLFIKRLINFSNYKNLLGHLILRDLKIKYRRSFLGYIWSVLNPLLIMFVMVVVFSKVFQITIPNFPVYLLTGQILFSFMSESTNSAMYSIVGSAPLLKKIYVPKYIFTVSKVMSAIINSIFSLVALIIVMLITGASFSFYNLLFPFIFVQLFAFCLGLGLLLAQLNVFFRDIQYIYGVLITAWTYATPIFYPESILTGNLRFFIKMFNPMYHYISQFRAIMLYGQFPDISTIISGSIYAVIFLIMGILVFSKKQDKFILYI